MHYQEISNRVSQLEVYGNPLQQGKRIDSLHVTSYIFVFKSTQHRLEIICNCTTNAAVGIVVVVRTYNNKIIRGKWYFAFHFTV